MKEGRNFPIKKRKGRMKKVKKNIYLGMENKPYEVYETVCVKNGKLFYLYENDKGKKVMLRAIKDNSAYFPTHDFMRYMNPSLPICKAGELYPIDILDRGYSGHYFELVEM